MQLWILIVQKQCDLNGYFVHSNAIVYVIIVFWSKNVYKVVDKIMPVTDIFVVEISPDFPTIFTA